MSADKVYQYGLPLGHQNLGLSSEYEYHQAMAQHMASTSRNPGMHPAMSQMMMPAGLNFSMNSGNSSLALGMQSVSSSQTMSPAGNVMRSGKAKHKKPKVNKDGVPAPKRATTAYINFTQWYREEQKRSGRQIPKIGEFGKECADQWNNMTPEEKQPFLEVAARDRERYQKEMAIFKPARDANKPKRPGTAFMLFMADLRKEMAGKEPEGGVAALAKLGGERWRNMTDEEKRKYIEKQGEEKSKYEVSMEEYRKLASSMQQSNVNIPLIKSEEPSNDSSGSIDLASGSTMSQVPQVSQASLNNECLSPAQDGSQTSASQSNSPPPTLSPEPVNKTVDALGSENSPTSMAEIPSVANSMPIAHAASLGYAPHLIPNFSQSCGVLMHNPSYDQVQTMPSSCLSSSGSNYIPAHLQGLYNWN